MRDRNWRAKPRLLHGRHPAVFTADNLSADEELLNLLNPKPRLLSWREGEDCVKGEKRKC
jgi:hypothetical protein